MRTLLKCAAALLFVSAVAVFSGCSTSEHSHHHGDTHAAQSESAHGAATHQADVTVPDKTADVFSEIEKHFKELGTAIQSKDARMAHQHDSAIRTLAASLPQRATSDTKADAETLVRDIADAAKSAHHSAHEDQWDEAANHVKHGQASLAKLKASFKESPR